LQSPISATDIRSELGQYRDILDHDVALTDAMGDRLLAALVSVAPATAPIVDDLRDSLDARGDVSSAAELLAWEKDAAGVLLQTAGIKRDVLRTWQAAPPADPTPLRRVNFVAGLSNRRVHEGLLIAHDAERFPRWLSVPVADVGWRMFTKEETGDELLIYNANNQGVEDALGVDLIYYHEQYRSFVLVQYKKLERGSHLDDWGYRPDDSFVDQLRRMREIDDASTESDHPDYRIFYKPCWVKLAKEQAFVNDTDDLIHGMYLPREVVERLIDDPSTAGPHGGTRLTYDNVPRYLNNTTFTNLVGDGWIGSSGTGTDLILKLIVDALDGDRVAVVGIHRTKLPPGNSPRRRYARPAHSF
jgi:hypothetical protein